MDVTTVNRNDGSLVIGYWPDDPGADEPYGILELRPPWADWFRLINQLIRHFEQVVNHG